MKISAIVPTYNRRDALRDCIQTLIDQDLAKDQYEIVVVVDGSSDGTTSMLRSLASQANLVIIEQENKGKSAAINAGMNAASSDIVLIIDDDFLCDPSLLSTHLASHGPDSRVLVSGQILSAIGPSPSLAERKMHQDLEDYYARLAADPRLQWPGDAWAGPNCSMSRDVFFESGGSDERNFPRREEDSDLGLRLWRIGIRFQYEPQAKATHRWVKSNQAFLEDCVEDGASLLRLSRKYPETRPHWGFSSLANATWKARAARVICSNQTIVRLTFDLGMFASERLARLSSTRGMAGRIFQICTRLAGLAGARREAGSWHELINMYS